MDFDTIYREYFQTIYYYLRSLTSDPAEAEELTQETFFKVLKAVNQLDTGKNVRAWLFTIAKNTILGCLPKKPAPATHSVVRTNGGDNAIFYRSVCGEGDSVPDSCPFARNAGAV